MSIIKRIRNLRSGIRTLSRTVEGGSLRLGVNVEEGEEIGPVNNYNIEFNNGKNEALIDCLENPLVCKLLFPRRIKEMDSHIDQVLGKRGYFTEW